MADAPATILFVGDIVGGIGKRTLLKLLPDLRERYAPTVVLVNGENAAGGLGITPKIADELFAAGVDVITLGMLAVLVACALGFWRGRRQRSALEHEGEAAVRRALTTQFPGPAYHLLNNLTLPISLPTTSRGTASRNASPRHRPGHAYHLRAYP